METRNKLVWNTTKNLSNGGKVKMKVSLDDDCHNGICDFSITGEVYDKKGECETCGCIHDTLKKHFPEIEKFLPLHLCDYRGTPLYPVENGIYHFKHYNKQVVKDYLRITDTEYDILGRVLAEKLYFGYLLIDLGIAKRWKEEADEFIAFLEDKLNCKWENPYKPEEEKHKWCVSTQEIVDIRKQVELGYYNPDKIEEREDERKKREIEKARQEILKDYAKAELKAREERDTLLAVIDFGLPVNNVIYYDHTKVLAFNWKDFDDKISQEDFDRFVEQVDYSKLPEGITIVKKS